MKTAATASFADSKSSLDIRETGTDATRDFVDAPLAQEDC
jgi:hypothetical protein